jgi:hypothetical protein
VMLPFALGFLASEPEVGRVEALRFRDMIIRWDGRRKRSASDSLLEVLGYGLN